MPYLRTPQAWLHESALLLKIRPTTTRITTKYSISKHGFKPKSPKPPPTDFTAAATTTTDPPATSDTASIQPPTPAPPTMRATLILKTYNSISGVTLKYKTDKAAEVGRLISSLARLGRTMAGLPEVKENVAMLDAQVAEGEGGGVRTPASEALKAPAVQVGGGQGSKKGKKRGKK